MNQASARPQVVSSRPNRVQGPRLLVQLEPWYRVFFRNLRDLVWPRREASLWLTSRPAAFWPDVFVSSRTPWSKFGQSIILHTLAIGALWASSQFLFLPARVADRPAFSRNDVVTYSPAEYLPPLDTGNHGAKAAQKGDPVYAPQPILSVPPEADNRRQTIVTPPNLLLHHDVPLPNIVAWSQAQVAVPIAATARAAADLKMPTLSTAVIAPAPDMASVSHSRDVRAPEAAIVEPPPTVQVSSTRNVGQLNIGHQEVVAPAPQLTLAEQRAMSGARPSLGEGGASVVPPPPSIQGSGTSRGGGQLIALSVQPAAPSGPIEPPAGNRRGTFAASPEGKAGASGTPDVVAGNGSSPGGGSNGSGAGDGAGSGRSNGLPAGLHVGAVQKPTSSVAGSGGSGNGAGHGAADPQLLADAKSPRVSAKAGETASEVSSDRASDLERKVFGDRKFYSMTLNMPNLNSAGGSWVIRFAELAEDDSHGVLSAPVATRKVDPAYPTETMRRNVSGTVTLYAVIHSDGSVSAVKVLRGIDDDLDEYARQALARWRFEPATKNGAAVDVAAVVMIPFRPSRFKRGF